MLISLYGHAGLNTDVSFTADSYGRVVLTIKNAELNSIFHLLALLGAHHILHFSRIRVKAWVCGRSPAWTLNNLSSYALQKRLASHSQIQISYLNSSNVY
jgi:hypothetical protein